MQTKNDINIVLVEPEIPQNTGNVARTCAATGASLHLVKPLGFTITDSKLKRAGLDYWDKLDITYHESLAEFLRTVEGEQLFFFTTKGPRAHSDIVYPKRVFLIFGKETRGLPEELLAERYDRCVRLPMRESLRSLNLSNSVAVAVYEVLRQRNYEGLEKSSPCNLADIYGKL
ncbi:MAG: tRNA (uridine(34)/cytosine(34)/5-carboxymethylaminomethyluridine(34)-2'-O)-methyltransferase TrmL [Eubacteriales bacterium]|jgi:tRNA (cytidine/uridine-2'-O-)-methyltransferase|nr:tRNA (uridine(34)/cytosine(34)/5-carboxymethylaminomethyluridine(34)-2'-O)-methyltransferase TrmL [Clostridiales bacterium]